VSEAPLSLTASIDTAATARFLANMIELWLDAEHCATMNAEVSDERRDQRATSQETRLRLRAP